MKKRKLQAGGGPASKRNKKAAPDSARRRVNDASALAWQSAGEEFGGLEVIENVQVVKTGDKLSFLVADADKQVREDEYEDDGESFEGFDDEPTEAAEVTTKKEKKEKTRNETNTKKAKEPKQQKAKANAEADELANKRKNGNAQLNAFQALEQVQDDDDVDMEEWVALNLSPPIVSAIAKLGFAKPTAIQEQSIPVITSGEDVIGKAQTGSGKTLAFGIPIVERWLETHQSQPEGDRSGPIAVVLSPTRELAKQLGDHIKALCDSLEAAPYVCVVTGGLSIQKQQRQLAKADIVIGTPGRLWEVLEGDMELQDEFTKIQFLVVDEADRLFKVGQFKEAELIIGALDKHDPEAEADESYDELPPRQTLVFSATFDKNLQTKLAGKNKALVAGSDEEKMAYLMKCLKFRSKPKFIDVNPVSQMAEGLREGLIECGAMEKVCKMDPSCTLTALS
jgi:ATP-dependent RNA helicase DDX24/MAK5